MKKLLVQLYGGLGNQLFQYSAGIELSKKYLRDAVFVHDLSSKQGFIASNYLTQIFTDSSFMKEGKKFNNYFQSKALLIRKIEFNSKFYCDYKKIQLQKQIGYDSNFSLNKETRKIVGYFQSYLYAEATRVKIKEKLSKIFTEKESKNIVANLLQKRDVTALHLRRGDYLDASNYHGLLTKNYYQKALEFTKTKNVLVFSNDRTFADKFMKNLLQNSNLNYKLAPSLDELETLFLFSSCNKQIIANSTFSWWGAFLSDISTEVCYPEPWFRKGNTPSNLAPRHWIPIKSSFEN